MSKDCLFCRIIKGEIPAKIVYENDKIMVFDDISPQAKIHQLVIPKKHYKDIVELALNRELTPFIEEVSDYIQTREEMKSSFRLVNNCGEEAGQSVFHVHIHILSGEKLKSFGC